MFNCDVFNPKFVYSFKKFKLVQCLTDCYDVDDRFYNYSLKSRILFI